jgi:signal transduction histidine kinase
MNTWKRKALRALKEVPIFYRIVIANTAMAGTVIVTLATFGTEAVAVVVVLASGLVNALLVGAALKVDGMREQQRDLFAWSLNQAERERRRVAYEIRESAAQRLAALMLAPGHEAVKTEAAAVMQELVDTAETLQPPRIEFLGLPGALAWYSRSIERRLGIPVRITTDGPLDSFKPEVTLGLYRMLEDIVETMAQHLPVTLDVCIAATDQMVASSVWSYGTSEPPRDFTEAEVFRLQERAACLAGKLEVVRTVDSICVHVTTPIREAHARYDSRLVG